MPPTSYIPPEGLRFRLVGCASQCAIYSRDNPDPTIWHLGVSHGEYPDQWFTLLHGTGNRAGRYAIKSQTSGKVLFSRKTHPPVGHTEGNGKYEDNWFEIEPHLGQYAVNSFRLITLQSFALYSRLSADPTFSNFPSTSFHANQLFHFIWEDMKVDKVEYNLDAGRILSSTPVTLTEQVLVTNSSDSEQEISFSVDKSVTRSSTFEYNTGFTVNTGTKFSAGVPFVVESRFSAEVLTGKTWTWGETTEYGIQYTATFPVRAAPRKIVRATFVVNQGMLEVPFTMYLSSKSSGVKVQTVGTWHGVSSWDIRYTITTLN